MRESFLPVDVHPGVYPPGEDTYVLQDAIKVLPSDTMLDMGCGSGYISLNFIDQVRCLVAVDIQFTAAVNTRENLRRRGVLEKAHVIQSDLFSAIKPSSMFSIIAFNPPYLPQDDESSSMDSALIGGKKGVEVSERFIDQCVQYLLPDGRVYLVTSSLADVQCLKEAMKIKGLVVESAREESLFFEKLVVLRGVLEGK